MNAIYHITHPRQWEIARETGALTAPSLHREGFIHCSTPEQVCRVADAIYHDAHDLLLLEIAVAPLGDALRWEAPAHPEGMSAPPVASEELFPHVYSAIPLDAVTRIWPFLKNDCGHYVLPGDIRPVRS